MSGGRHWGKARVPDCYCTYNFTCGACLRAAPPWHYTTTPITQQVAEQVRQDHERIRNQRRNP